MGLLTPGYWPNTYWPDGYWPDDYWPEGEPTPFPLTIVLSNSLEYSIVLTASAGGNSMSTFQVGETPKLEADITATNTGAAADPPTITTNIVDPAGTAIVSDLAMTKNATGDYYHDYQIPSNGNIGTWYWNVVATGSGGRVTIMRSSFEVEASI